MSFSQRFEEIRTGFERPFWIANITEIFERLAYYGAFASLALYLQEQLNFSTEQTGTLTGIFGGWCGFSPSLAARPQTGWDFAARFRWRISSWAALIF